MDNNFSQQTNTDTNSWQQGNAGQQTTPYMGNGYNGYGSSYNYGGNMEPEKAPNIFQQFALAFIPPRYNRLTKVKTGSMIGFVTLLALIATIISYVSVAIVFAPGDGREWMNAIPDFEIADGRLYMDGDFEYDESGMYVYMTDDVSGFSYDTASGIAAGGYRNVVLIGRDRISIWQNGEYQQGDLKNLGSDMEISKDWIVGIFMPLVMVFVTVGYLIFFVGRVFWYFLCAAVYLLFAMIIASIMKKQYPAGALFRVAVYSKVLMFAVTTLLSVVPFVHYSVPLFIRIVITMVFMGVAIAQLPEKN